MLQNYMRIHVLVKYKVVILATIPSAMLFLGGGVNSNNLLTETDKAMNLLTEV